MINRLLNFIKAKWTFQKMTKSKYIIYEKDNSELILKYISRKQTQIVSFKSLNFFILIKLIIEKKKISKLNYLIKAIEIANPVIIITMIDNDTNFYRLKKYFPNKKFIAIQNGYRTEPKKTYLIKKREKLSCDIIFCFGNQNMKYYKSFINTKVIPLGSIKNNLIDNNYITKKKMVTYISEFRLKDEQRKINFYNLGKIYWEDFLSSEKRMLKILGKYCNKNQLTLNIVGRSVQNDGEKEFFLNVLKDINFNYIKKKNIFSSYNFLRKSEIIVSMSSSLGYEFLSRDNKIIFFSRKINNLNNISKYYNFGWPSVKKKRGFFFSNSINKKELERLFKNVLNCSNQNWYEIKKKYQKNIISFNYKNNLLKKELKT